MNPRRLYRSRDRQLAGVAGGMAEYLDIDPTVVRILWIVVGIASGGLVLLAYLILALVIPQAPYADGARCPGRLGRGRSARRLGRGSWRLHRLDHATRSTRMGPGPGRQRTPQPRLPHRGRRARGSAPPPSSGSCWS